MLLPLLSNLRMFGVTPPTGVRTGGVSRMVLAAKAAGDTIRLTFDFVSKLTPGEYLVDVTFNIGIYTGNAAIIPLVMTGSPIFSGTKVSQLITGGDESNIYFVECIGTTNSGDTPYLTSYLAVR